MPPKLVDIFLKPLVGDDRSVTGWKFYASRWEEVRGECLKTLCCTEGRAQVILSDGEWYLRAVPILNGREGNWEEALPQKVTVGAVRAPVNSLGNPALSAVRPGAGIRASFDAPAADSDDQYVEVIEGPSAERGKLIGVVPVSSFLDPRDRLFLPRLPGAVIPAEGSAQSFTRKVWLRPVGHGGGAGAAVSADLPLISHPDAQVLTLAQIEGGTNTNFTAPLSGETVEIVASDGARLKAIPAWDLADSAWGAWDVGILADAPYGSYYFRSGTLVSVTHDFGVKREFQLAIYDEFQRKSDTAKMPAGWELDDWDWNPALRRDAQRFSTDECFFRNEILTWEGKPLRPLPAQRWEYELDLSGTWRAYEPEAVLVATKVRVRVQLAEPTGLFQLISPRILVQAILPRFRYQKDGVVYGAGLPQLVVPLVNHPVTGATPWNNEMFVKVQTDTVPVCAAVIAKAPAANPPTFTVACWDTATGLPPAAPVTLMYEVSGY